MVDHIVHILAIYDGKSEDLIEIIELPHFSPEKMIAHYEIDTAADPDIHNRYSVGPDDISIVNQAAGREISFDFTANGYFIEAVRDDREG